MKQFIALILLFTSVVSKGQTTGGRLLQKSNGEIGVGNGKTLTVNNSVILAGTDGSTLNFGNGGTLAAVAISGSASDLTTGTIGTARLGSGTANSSTFLRGDGTWATVSGAGTVTSVGSGWGTSFSTITGSGSIVLDSTSSGVASWARAYKIKDSILSIGYITGNQSITLSGDISGTGSTSIAVTIGNNKVTNAMLAGSIASSKLVGTDIATVGTITSGTWNGTILGTAYGGTGVDNSTGGTANTFWARPNGATGAASYRAIVAADIPTLNQNTTGSAATLTTSRNINGVAFNGSADINDDVSLNSYLAGGSPWLAQTMDLNLMQAGTSTALVDNTLRLVPVYLPKAATVTGIRVYVRTQGSYTGDNNNKVGLYSYSGGTMTLVASSTNSSSLWTSAANAFQTIAFSSTYSASAGLYFVGLLYNNSAQTTAPTLAGGTAFNNVAMVTYQGTNSIKYFGTLGSSNDLPSSQAMSGVTGVTASYWVALY